MENKDLHITSIKSELSKIEEKQMKNRQELAQLDEIEKDFFETHQKGEQLFDRLFQSWNKDEEMAGQLEREESNLLIQQRRILEDIESRRSHLAQENRNLEKMENELFKKLKNLH